MKKKLVGMGIVLALLLTATISLATINNNPPVIIEAHYDATSNVAYCTPEDPDGDLIRVGYDWDSDSAGTADKWTQYHESGEEQTMYPVPSGCKQYSVVAQDEHGAQSSWFEIKAKPKQINLQSLLFDFLEKYPNLFPILRLLIKL
jgi:hypothetical protein